MQIPFGRFLISSLLISTVVWAQSPSAVDVKNGQSENRALEAPHSRRGVVGDSVKRSREEVPSSSETGGGLNFDLEPLVAAEPNQSAEIKSVIMAQLEDVRDGDLSKAYYAYGSVEFLQTVPLDTFKIFLKSHPEFLRNRTFEIQNVSFSGVLVSVKGVLIDSNQHKTLVQYDLIQENGVWKVRKVLLFAPKSA